MDVLAALGQGPECFLSHLYLRNITRAGLLVCGFRLQYNLGEVLAQAAQAKLFLGEATVAM